MAETEEEKQKRLAEARLKKELKAAALRKTQKLEQEKALAKIKKKIKKKDKK